MTRHVAVVGSGVSGLVAGWVLARDAQVTLYEADDRLGGHADTHDVEVGEHTLAVDTGFIVHNERTYPTLLRLFDELGVVTQESDMSMSVRDEETGLEWAGALGAQGLFPTSANLRNPRYLRMLTEIPRFHRMAKQLLATPETDDDELLSAFLERGRFTDFFSTYFMTPLVAAVWSTDPDHALEYPARYLFSFLDNHGMLAVTGSPVWRTVTGGSRTYVELAGKELTEVRLSTPVRSVRRFDDHVEVDGERFDDVVIAVHPAQALRMLDDATPLETELLSAITYTPNPTVLHDDTSLLPTSARAQASWNVRLSACSADEGAVLVSYDMNRLQRLETPDRYVVTLNAAGRIAPDRVIDAMEYEHPLYTTTSVAAQARLPEISTGRTAFAGAYHGWGFHEDGALSGLKAAESLWVTW